MPGITSLPNLPAALVDGNQILRTQFGIILPPGAHVAAYVRSTGAQSGDDAWISSNLVATLDAGLKRCRSGLGDYVICLPGHSESVTDATMLANLVAGTRVIGVGNGGNRPVFRWTATGSQWAITKADVIFAGLKLRLEGANGVVKAIISTAADTIFQFNVIEVASGATAKATICMEMGAGADRFGIIQNEFYGTETHNVTDGIKVVAANLGGRIIGNEMIFSATAANGLVHFTAAALRTKTIGNYIYNTHTASSAALVYDNVAVDGICSDNRCGCINTGTLTSGTICILDGAASLVKFFENYGVNDIVKSGILLPSVDT